MHSMIYVHVYFCISALKYSQILFELRAVLRTISSAGLLYARMLLLLQQLLHRARLTRRRPYSSETGEKTWAKEKLTKPPNDE